jgi:hypothetical protein
VTTGRATAGMEASQEIEYEVPKKSGALARAVPARAAGTGTGEQATGTQDRLANDCSSTAAVTSSAPEQSEPE